MSAEGKDMNRRILVIDDNSAIHADFRKILAVDEAAAGADLAEAAAAFFGEPVAQPQANLIFELTFASQGQEGLQLVREARQAGRPFALAFVDVRMPPGWDGVQTLAEIWKVDPDLQAVICTAYSDYAFSEMLAKLGHTDRFVILKKPFDSVEVLQLANALTEKWDLLQRANAQIKDLMHDVDERTTQLRQTEECYRLITENASDFIALINGTGDWAYNSPSYERTLGYAAAELRGTSAFAHVHAEDRPRLQLAIRECLAGRMTSGVELRFQHRNGSWRTLESCHTLIPRINGRADQLLVVSRDITERRKQEGDRLRMEIQLRHSQKLESLGQLAAGIAHEINTPTQYIGDNTRFLQDVFGNLSRLLQKQQTLQRAAKAGKVSPELLASVEQAEQAVDVGYLLEEIPQAIQQSLEGVQRVAKIVRAMKDFSHPDANEKTVVDLNKSIESTLTVCRNEWKYVAEMVTEFDPALPGVECLPGEINQVILNLVINAAHAIADVVGDGGKGKGTITVATRRDAQWAEIRVRDTGTGIPETARPKIFDPFFTTKTVGKGTGQGLAIAHAVVVGKHSGTIRFETELGKGTTFIIRLPIVSPTSTPTAPPKVA